MRARMVAILKTLDKDNSFQIRLMQINADVCNRLITTKYNTYFNVIFVMLAIQKRHVL